MNLQQPASTDSIETNKPFKQVFKDLISISIANYGDNKVTLNVNGVRRTLPVWNDAKEVPTYAFGYGCEGNPFEIEIELEFPNGASRVIIDKATYKNC